MNVEDSSSHAGPNPCLTAGAGGQTSVPALERALGVLTLSQAATGQSQESAFHLYIINLREQEEAILRERPTSDRALATLRRTPVLPSMPFLTTGLRFAVLGWSIVYGL